jgi:hypothetical protein
MALVMQINPQVSFIDEVQSFVKEVSATVEAQELREWEQQVREYGDKVKSEQMRIQAFKEIAVEYAKNQPKKIIYNTLTTW